MNAADGSTSPALYTTDYSSTSGMVADVDFAIGATTATVTYTAVSDEVIEDCETFTLTLALDGTTDYAIVDPVGPSTVYLLDRTGT